MKTTMIRLLSVCVGVLALGAYAADAAKEQEAEKTDKKPKVVVRNATAEEEAKIPDGYTLVKRKGVEFFCRNERVLGSRTQTKQICQTKEQIEAERNSATSAVDYANRR